MLWVTVFTKFCAEKIFSIYKAEIAEFKMLCDISRHQSINQKVFSGFKRLTGAGITKDYNSLHPFNDFYTGGRSQQRTSRNENISSGWEDNSGGWKIRPVLISVHNQDSITIIHYNFSN